MNECCICQSNKVKTLLDLGKQPVSNRFLKSIKTNEFKHQLTVGFCNSCGIIQLINPFPADELRPPYDWITYNEPEAHLDELSGILSKLPNLSKESKICGISFKDDTLLERMKKHGFSNVIRLDPKKDLDIEDGWTGVETVQNQLNIQRAKKFVEKNGKHDLIIVRHILEHTYNPIEFMKSISHMLKPDGYVMFEVPDCTKSLENYDYSSLWEEHTLYFTPETFKNCFSLNNFTVEKFRLFPYILENCLVAILKSDKTVKNVIPDEKILKKENDRAISFSEEFSKIKVQLQSFFSSYKNEGKEIALFGAGHCANVFINIHEISDSIKCVIDDNIHKQGMFMPGSQLPIISSSALLEEDLKLSVLSLNPEIEKKVVEKNRTFIERGGDFLSIIPTSERSVYSKLSNNLGYKKINEEVYYTKNKVPTIGNKEIEMLKNLSKENKRRRCRICVHKDINEKLHEMFIIHEKGTYVRPHKHLNKSESMHIIEGSADVIIFDEKGNIRKIESLDNYRSGEKFFYRLDEPLYHTLNITSDVLIYHETTIGPFDRKDTVFAPWSPEEKDEKGVKKFLEKIEKITNYDNMKEEKKDEGVSC